MKQRGLSILELLVVLMIMVIITTAVLAVMDHTRKQSMEINELLERQGAIQHCLNLLVDDITNAATRHGKIEIDHHTLADGRTTSHLTILTFNRLEQMTDYVPKSDQEIVDDLINPLADNPLFPDNWDVLPETQVELKTAPPTDQGEPDVRIDWVAVPRFEQNDLVLFRREQSLTTETDLYIPLCENISSFEVLRITPDGIPSRDTALPLIEISAYMYRPGPPDPHRVFTARRTFCSDRFIGARPIDIEK